MRAITIAGFERPKVVSAGALPNLRWLPIADLLVDPSDQRPITSKDRRKIERIAKTFRWSCFAPVIVVPVKGGKFAIVDGESRTVAAALIGLENVPCQIVVADRQERAVARKAINDTTSATSRLALHAAALGNSDSSAARLAEICARAEVEMLRYPVPVNRQSAGQTMAVAALKQCLRRHGEETLITALQCVTQTANKRPGTLSARIIKALCEVLDRDHGRRDSGLALFEAFDKIDLLALQSAALRDAVVRKINPVEALADRIRSELHRLLPANALPSDPPRNDSHPFVGHHGAGIEIAVSRKG